MNYDITSSYWKYDSHVVAITDDLMWARTFVLDRVRHDAGGLTADQFRCFEELFEEFTRDTSRSLYFAVGDHHYCIRESQVRVAVGGMSTI